MRLDYRCFIHAQHLIVGVVFLNCCTVLEIDASVQGGRKSPANPTLRLPFEAQWIDDATTIEGTHNAVNANTSATCAMKQSSE